MPFCVYAYYICSTFLLPFCFNLYTQIFCVHSSLKPLDYSFLNFLLWYFNNFLLIFCLAFVFITEILFLSLLCFSAQAKHITAFNCRFIIIILQSIQMFLFRFIAGYFVPSVAIFSIRLFLKLLQ